VTAIGAALDVVPTPAFIFTDRFCADWRYGERRQQDGERQQTT